MLRRKAGQDEQYYLLFLSAMFLCGCFCGRYVSSNLSGDGLLAAYAAVDQLLDANARQPDFDMFIDSFSSAVKFPVAVFLLGLTPAGKTLTGLLFTLKGFLITFFVGVVSSAAETGSYAAVLFSIIPTCIFSLPCMLLLAMGRSGQGDINRYGRLYIPSSAAYFLLLIPAVIADMYICPFLIGAFAF